MSERTLTDALFSTPPAAVTAPKRKQRPEATVQRAVVRELERAGIMVERRSVGFDRERSIAFGTKGEPDLRLSFRGRTAGVEVKAPGSGRLSEHQVRWTAKHGHHVPTFVVDSVAGARRVAALLTGATSWPVAGADLRGLR